MSEETDLAISFKEDHVKIPPLFSNSPPPLQFTNSEDDENDATLQRPNITSDFMKLSDSSTSSSSSLPKFNQSNVQYEEKSVAKLKDFDQDWNSNDNSNTLFKEETNDSQWANFEPSFNDIQTTDNQIKNHEISFNESKPIDDMNDNDDEWGNFVEIEQVYIPTNETNKKNEQSTTLPFDLDTILDEIFIKNQINSFNKYNDLIVDNLQIETDELWQQIQNFTTVTDSSESLQFKWCLSLLEDNYFNSLNIQRTSQIKTKNFRTLSPQTILQPVKIDSSKPVNNKTQTNEIKTPQLDITAPALNIDLSYFESKETNKTNLIKPNSNKTGSTSKVNLDKLLEEIFTSNNNRQESTSQKTITMGINGKSDDLFSDKKSLSSSSTSSSSSNINELNQSTSSSSTSNSIPMFLQLQPHMLEMQQMQTNKAYDEKALDIISKLSNVTFKNSKYIVLPR